MNATKMSIDGFKYLWDEKMDLWRMNADAKMKENGERLKMKMNSEEEIIKANWVKGYFKDLWINYFYTLSSSIYNLSDEVITLFSRNKEIEIELGCDANKISIIPNGIEIEEYQHVIRTLPEDKISRFRI